MKDDAHISWTGKGQRVMACEEIQALLFDYMTRELGTGRSDLVREHLRKCTACQQAAAEMQDTLNLLHRANSGGDNVPARLSEQRRARILWALAHPVLDWMYRHHILVSILSTALALTLAALLLRGIHILKTRNWRGVTVNIGKQEADPAATEGVRHDGPQPETTER